MDISVTAQWKPGFENLHKADAQKVAMEITAIGSSATPAQIVDAARDPESELHKCFEWRDDVAAEKYRIQQARQVVCHLVIRETVIEERPAIRFFYKPEATSGYQRTQLIVRNQDAYQALLSSAIRDLDALRKKYHSLTELEQVFDAIEQLLYGKVG